MIRETLNRTEVKYLAGESIEDAQFRASNEEYEASDTSQDAWNQLPYWDREEEPERFEVYEFVTETRITKVDPPYSKVDLT